LSQRRLACFRAVSASHQSIDLSIPKTSSLCIFRSLEPSVRTLTPLKWRSVLTVNRRVAHFNVTEHPTAAWTAQQIVEVFPEETAPRFLLRDRDQIYGEEFRQRVAGMKIEEIITAPHSPWQTPYVERLIGSIRRECLDHVIVVRVWSGAPAHGYALISRRRRDRRGRGLYAWPVGGGGPAVFLRCRGRTGGRGVLGECFPLPHLQDARVGVR